jgi:choline dehydrogenase-like flavoprotein
VERPFVWIRSRQLGGRTHVWRFGTPRLSREEMAAPVPEGDGEPWPLTYDELFPWYEIAERAIGVVSGPLARALTGRERRLKRAIESRWRDRQATLFPYADPTGPGLGLVACQAYVGGDGTLGPTYACNQRSTLARALRTGRLALRTDAIVESVTTTNDGRRATGVRIVDRLTRSRVELHARSVVLSASALESTRILMNSRSDLRPEGLANSSGALGTRLTDHLWGIGLRARLTDPGFAARALSRVGRAAARVVMSERLLRRATPPLLIHPFPDRDFPFRAQFSCQLEAAKDGRLYAELWAHGEAGSYARNRVTLDTEVCDDWGIPTLKVDYERSQGDAALCDHLRTTLEEIAQAIGGRVTERRFTAMAPGVSAHELGTARMGRSAATSVVNANCQAWDVPNLFVCDGAVFPRATARNPTLTMMALTARACDHLARTVLS